MHLLSLKQRDPGGLGPGAAAHSALTWINNEKLLRCPPAGRLLQDGFYSEPGLRPDSLHLQGCSLGLSVTKLRRSKFSDCPNTLKWSEWKEPLEEQTCSSESGCLSAASTNWRNASRVSFDLKPAESAQTCGKEVSVCVWEKTASPARTHRLVRFT